MNKKGRLEEEREREVQRYLTVSLGGEVRRGSHHGAGGEVVDVQWW